MKLFIATLLTFVLIGPSMACTADGKEGFLPENDMYIPVGVKSTGGLTEEQFNSVISKLEAIYVPLAAQLGGRLKIARKWGDGTVNANANRIFGWNVNMYGGLARHPAITEDGFALVLCHEIGHHMGGATKVRNLLMRSASNEGQSDYFATLKCLRRLFLNDDNVSIVRKLNAPAHLVTSCQNAHGNSEDVAMCIRGGMAGASVSGLFAAMRNSSPAKFDTPDTNVVTKTNDAHPHFQCRLDTYFQGALCDKSFNEDVSQKDVVKGTCHESTGHTVGLRPRCWYAP